MKRIFDFSIALIALATLAIPMLLVFFLVRIFLGKPAIFAQARPGLHGKIFKMYKFRSMTDSRAPSGELLPDKDRLTTFGRLLRSSSLDELPELWNILRGDMSLVGPRPLLTDYLELYTPEQAKRHNVKPGITGWAQINGRNSIDWNTRLQLDVWYVEHQTFFLDIKILVLTVMKVIRREGISAGDHSTMTKFTGSKK